MSSSIADFVARQNLAHFRRQLENETDSKQRKILLRLLIEQEDLVGRTCEDRVEVASYITRVKGLIRRQLETIAALKARRQSVSDEERKLCALLDLLIVHERHHAKSMLGSDPNVVGARERLAASPSMARRTGN